jgi:SAM-dependent methyltransferase
MPIRNTLTRILGLPEAQGIDPDLPEMAAIHRSIILRKPFLRKLYGEHYQMFCEQAARLATLPGDMLELGSGGGFLKKHIPDLITSDVYPDASLDQVVLADRLPFEANTLKAVFLLNVLHHLPQSQTFLKELNRCLVPGGRAVMIEPYNSLWGRFFYKYLHHEPFDETVKDWESPARGRLSTSNQALPWIIFFRDRALFEQRFPRLKIVEVHLHTVTRYLLSGGLTARSMAPSFTFPFFSRIDRWLSSFKSLFPIFQTIVLEKQ